MKISDFSMVRLESLRRECNFTGDEPRVFDMLAKDFSLKKICSELPCGESKATRLKQSIERKVMKVL